MNQHNKTLNRLKSWLDLSVPTTPGMPIVEIAGNRRVLIENHNGIAEYGNEKIVILVKLGKIIISGTQLEVCNMSRHQLVIVGCIDAVSVERL